MAVYKLRPATMAYAPDTPVTGVQLNTSITDTDTTIPLVNASDLPAQGVIQLESEEILYLTNDGSNISNCLRGFRGTTAAAHDGSTTPIDVTHLFTIVGKTQGGITLNTEQTSQSLHTDQDGETPVDDVVTGKTCTIEANLAEITLENLALAYGTTVQGTTGSRRVEVKPDVGRSLLNTAKKTLLIPYVGTTPSNDVEELITLPKAGLKSAVALTFDSSTQQVLKVTFVGYPDINGNLVIYGKEA